MAQPAVRLEPDEMSVPMETEQLDAKNEDAILESRLGMSVTNAAVYIAHAIWANDKLLVPAMLRSRVWRFCQGLLTFDQFMDECLDKCLFPHVDGGVDTQECQNGYQVELENMFQSALRVASAAPDTNIVIEEPELSDAEQNRNGESDDENPQPNDVYQ